MSRIALTLRSTNRKTGPIPVSTSSETTCPDACPLKRNGCYAESGPLAIHWRKVTAGASGLEWRKFLHQIEDLLPTQLWRHNQAGDLVGDGNEIDPVALMELSYANRGKRGFTYTHKPMNSRVNKTAVKAANALGFTVNLSADSTRHADELAKLEIAPVVCVLPADVDGAKTPVVSTPEGRKVAVCPATYRVDVTCQSCALCQRRDRKVIVGFPAHGSAKRKASAIATTDRAPCFT
jgi:hypothetical protein